MNSEVESSVTLVLDFDLADRKDVNVKLDVIMRE